MVGNEQLRDFDPDAATMNYIASAGFAIAAIGYGATAATFFAAAAASSATGVGIAPGLLLAFIGTSVAITGQVLAVYADNTPIEALLLRTPWGTNPEKPLIAVTANELGNQYRNLMRIVSCFRVDIDIQSLSATIYLPNIEPETIVTIHEVVYGMPESADGSSQAISVVGSNITLSDKNCTANRNASNQGYSLKLDLQKICPWSSVVISRYKERYTVDPRPDYIKISISIDLNGDKTMILPDENKRVIAERYYGQATTQKIA